MSLRWLMRALLLVASTARDRDMVVGDLDEEWDEHIRPRSGKVAAEIWYAREGLSLVRGLLLDRIRARWEPDAPIRGPATDGGPGPRPGSPRSSSSKPPGRASRGGWATDLRQTINGLIRQPGFTVMALLTLGLGVGATVVMFTLVHAAYLRPLPYPDADRLVRVFTGYQDSLDGRNAVSPLTWRDAENRPDLVEATEVWDPIIFHLRDDSGTVGRVEAARVSAGLFELLGVRVAAGRLFSEAAVAAAGLTDQLHQEAPHRVENVGQRVNVVPLRQHLVGDTGAVLLLLLAAVGLVLVIGCANVMNLLLARSESRRREFALRRALGSGARRLGRLVVLETALLSTAAGVLGVAGATTIIEAIGDSPPATVAALGELAVGWPVVLFAVVLSLCTAFLFGMVPVASALTSAPSEVLRESSGRTAGSARGARIRSALVVLEVALAVVLVFGVGVTAESFRRLTTVAPGFEMGGKLALSLETPAEGYGGVERGAAYRRIFDRAGVLPGVANAAMTHALPLSGVVWSGSFDLVEPDPSVPDAALGGNLRPGSPGYFRTMGIPVLSGRGLESTDEPGSPPVVVVDEVVARRVWPDRSPLGERIQLGVFLGDVQEATVVGVVGNVRDRDLSRPGSGHVYFSAWQSPQREMVLVATTIGDSLAMAPQLRAIVAEVDPRIPVYDVELLSSLLDATLASPRLGLLLMGTFGAVALLLAAVGVYGVVSYTVALRTREICTRMALGASPGTVQGMVLRRVALLWVFGGVAGSVVALVARSIAAGLVFEIDGGNPLILAAAALGLGLVALVAAIAPARRAARLDAIEVLRGG